MKKERQGVPMLVRYFLSYFAIILLLVVVIATYSYNVFYKLHKEKIFREHQGSLALVRERTESELQLLLNSSHRFASSTEAMPFRFQQQPERMVPLRRQLTFFSQTNDFFSNVYLYFDTDDYVYSTLSLYPLETFTHEMMQYDSLTPEELTEALQKSQWLTVLPEQTCVIWSAVTKRVIPVVVPIGYLEGMRSGALMYYVDSQRYGNILQQISDGNKNVYIVQDDQVVFKTEAFSISEDEVLTQISGKSTTAIRTFQQEDREYSFHELSGDQLNLRYYMIAPMDDMKPAFSSTVSLFFLIIAVVVTLSLLLVFYFTKTGAQPIQQLYQLLTNKESSRNPLQEITENVELLLHDRQALTAKVSQLNHLQRVDFLRKFITDGFVTTAQMIEEAEGQEIFLQEKYVVGILAKPRDSHISWEELRPFVLTQGAIFYQEDSKGTIIFVASASTEEELLRQLETQLVVLQEQSPDLKMAISGIHEDYSQGSTAYLQAERSFEKRFLSTGGKIMRWNPAQEKNIEKTTYDFNYVERLRLALLSANTSHVTQALEEISKAMRRMDSSLIEFRCLYNDVLAVFIRESSGDPALEQEVYHLLQLNEFLSLEELDQNLLEFSFKIIENRKEQDVKSEKIIQAMELIQENFSDPDFSIFSIAQTLHLSEAKLSIDFKEAYQMTPMECLTYHRMQYACKLLQTTDWLVKDIATACGYLDTSGFNRRFKAYTDKTPQQYRT